MSVHLLVSDFVYFFLSFLRVLSLLYKHSWRFAVYRPGFHFHFLLLSVLRPDRISALSLGMRQALWAGLSIIHSHSDDNACLPA